MPSIFSPLSPPSPPHAHTKLAGIVANTHELRERQETPDTPEALQCVPTLQLSDIPRGITRVPTDITQQQGATLLTHNLFTNNILYMEVRGGRGWGKGGR